MKTVQVCLAATAAAFVASSALAGVGGSAGATINSEGVIGNGSNGPWTLGWEFRVNSNINVTHLGYYDDGQNGLGASHAVGLWDAAGNLLATATVDPGDALDGFFRWQSITPVVLNAGSNYIVGGVSTNDNYTFDGSTSYAPEITFVSDRWAGGTALTFPTNVSGVSTPFFGGNFMFGEVPAPGALALLGLGGLVGSRRRRA